MSSKCWPVRLVAVVVIVAHSIAWGQSALPAGGGNLPAGLAGKLPPMPEGLGHALKCLSGAPAPWALDASLTPTATGKSAIEPASLKIERPTNDTYRVSLSAMGRVTILERTPQQTVLLVPNKKVAFVGKDGAEATLPLRPVGLSGRLVSSDSLLNLGVMISRQRDPAMMGLMLMNAAQLQPAAGGKLVSRTGGFSLQPDGQNLIITQADYSITLRKIDPQSVTAAVPDGYSIQKVERKELEQVICRAAYRGSEILLPGPRLTSPSTIARSVPGGKLMWIGNQRVVLLAGSPEAIGTAHGKLLKAEVQRSIDSTFNLIGFLKSVESGRWMADELRAAWLRLSPHIPESYKQEMNAIAAAADIDPETFRVLNVFPELFHCSGFAVSGSATADGKLYHGRVLDYMRGIGLQHSAAVFVVKPENGHMYMNVGYAGLIGSVTGMNDAQICLGEMGGRGEGQWDGVPMAVLMRRALEECDSLDQVKALWQNSPRTCEYYYVWSDGKTRQALGVSATPDKLEFVAPGQTHPLLGEGIADTVVLSQGKRLETLRQRISQQHGKIDQPAALHLMDAPVAMASNLHDVLFVPEDGVMFVAHADEKSPAWSRPYVKINAADLFKQLETLPKIAE